MAHLEVKPRKPYPWWIWALLLIIVIIAAIVVFQIFVDGDIPSNATVSTQKSFHQA